jgi:hypothetical protein
MPAIGFIKIPTAFLPLVASTAAFALGIFLLFLSRYFEKQHRLFEEQGIKVQGTVLRLVQTNANKELAITYHPVIRYTDQSGQEKEFQSHIGRGPARYRVGQEVPVVYVPGMDNTARLVEEQAMRVDKIVLMISLLVFGISGLTMVIFLLYQLIFFLAA